MQSLYKIQTNSNYSPKQNVLGLVFILLILFNHEIQNNHNFTLYPKLYYWFWSGKNKKTLPPKPPTDKMVNDCNCYKIKNIITTKRLQNYPFNQAQTITVIAFDSYFRLDSNYGSTSRTLIQNDSLVKKNLKQIITLDSTQIIQLTNIIFNYGTGKHCYANARAVYGCYEPRHAIVFLDSNIRIIDFFEICFECNSYITKDKLLENSLSKCNNQLSLIKKYFEQIGVTHWKDKERHNLILEK